MRPVPYHRPRSLAELFRLRDGLPGARLIAGGTDILVQLPHAKTPPPALISLRAIPELRGIDVGSEIRIGATTTIAEIATSAELTRAAPVLGAAARTLGHYPLRHMATLGGNLANASPCATMAPPLLVLEARVEILGPAGRRELPLDEFFLGPGKTRLAANEIIAAARFSTPPSATRAAFHAQGRVKIDIDIASAALLLELAGETCRKARIAVGAVAPTPLRLREVEDLLEGAPITADRLEQAGAQAAAAVLPITDIRASLEYRRRLIGVFVRRGVQQLVEAR